MAEFDLVVRNATIHDGLGNMPVQGDLAIRDGIIAGVGSVDGAGAQEIDAEGAVIAPGIVDVHTHYDAQLTWDPTASPSPALGVTTVVIGNCGFGIAPAPPEARATILANLSVVEAMSLDSLNAGVDFSFTSFAEYLELIQARKPFPNVAAFASHSVMRTAAMGDAGSEREATDAELEAMQAMFREALEAGAIGMGSSTFENHFGAGGRPVPSRMASDNEFRAFARTLGKAGGGLLMATCGDRTSIPLLGELARLAKGTTIYAPLLHYSNQPERAVSIARACAAEREAGRAVYPQVSCQPLSMDFTLEAAYPLLTITGWPESGDPETLKRAFADTSVRDQIRLDLSKPSGTRLFNGHWERLEVTITQDAAHEDFNGLTVAQLAAQQGADPLDAFLDLALSEDLKTIFTAKLLNVEEDRVAELLTMPGNIVSLSDAGAHHTLFCDAGFGIYLLSHWVRETGAFTLAEAIRKLTSEPAGIYGLKGRGELTMGAAADFIMFNPDRLKLSKSIKLKDLPADGERLVREAPGLQGTWVNGVRVHDGERYCDVEGPGRVLRREC